MLDSEEALATTFAAKKLIMIWVDGVDIRVLAAKRGGDDSEGIIHIFVLTDIELETHNY